jgi:hypothetical protein
VPETEVALWAKKTSYATRFVTVINDETIRTLATKSTPTALLFQHPFVVLELETVLVAKPMPTNAIGVLTSPLLALVATTSATRASRNTSSLAILGVPEPRAFARLGALIFGQYSFRLGR